MEQLPLGVPCSTDVSHTDLGAGTDRLERLQTARQVFLNGCGLLERDAAWADKRAWHILDTRLGWGLKFLVAWQAWRTSERAPDRLFFSAIEAQPVKADALLDSAARFNELADLAKMLAAQWTGMLPGVHRLVFEGGQVQLTVHVGQVPDVLPTLDAVVDSVFLDGCGHNESSEAWSAPLMKALARLCRPGTRLATWMDANKVQGHLSTTGFQVEQMIGLQPDHQGLQANYAPRWPVRPATRTTMAPPRGEQLAVVVGGGLAGSATAYSLAQRGWHVEVLDAADEPAAGASALPAGIVAPHVSPDDASLSRLSRSGVRLTLQRAKLLLETGIDWAPTGVLEHRAEGKRGLPRTESWLQWGSDWSTAATRQELEAAHLSDAAGALWHVNAGWIRPAQLVRAQLRHPGIFWRGGCQVTELRRQGVGWQLLSANGQVLSEAKHVILASAWPTHALLKSLDEHTLPLHPLRGQISWGPMDALPLTARALLPPFPVNGHGAITHGMAGPDGQPGWFVGSTFDRGVVEACIRPEDRQANLAKLHGLLPHLAPAMAPVFYHARDWAGVRCTLPDRVPAVGPLAPTRLPGLYLCTGMGARGLTLSVLCGELLAALMHGEPWPTERKLVHSMLAERFEHKPL